MHELTPGRDLAPCKAAWAAVASFLLKNVTNAQPAKHVITPHTMNKTNKHLVS